MSDILQITFVISLLSGMFRMAAPILFAALGELITERSGVLNLGVEGMMLIGGFAGFLATYITGCVRCGPAKSRPDHCWPDDQYFCCRCQSIHIQVDIRRGGDREPSYS